MIVKLCVEKAGFILLIKKNQGLNKDKDKHGQSIRCRYSR